MKRQENSPKQWCSENNQKVIGWMRDRLQICSIPKCFLHTQFISCPCVELRPEINKGICLMWKRRKHYCKNIGCSDVSCILPVCWKKKHFSHCAPVSRGGFNEGQRKQRGPQYFQAESQVCGQREAEGTTGATEFNFHVYRDAQKLFAEKKCHGELDRSDESLEFSANPSSLIKPAIMSTDCHDRVNCTFGVFVKKTGAKLSFQAVFWIVAKSLDQSMMVLVRSAYPELFENGLERIIDESHSGDVG